MTKRRKIKDEDHLIRYIPKSRLRVDENSKVVGILANAFEPRPEDNNTLSSTLIEFFEDNANPYDDAIRALKSSLVIKKGSGFTIGNVENIKESFHSRKIKTRIVHSPSQKNKAHASVTNVPLDNYDLFEELAVKSWADLKLNT